MGSVSQSLTSLASGWGVRLAFVAMIAVAVFMFVRGLLTMVSWAADPARRRLDEIGAASEQSMRTWAATIAAAVQPFARYVMPTSDKELGSMQDRFIRGGFQSADAIAVFYGLKTLLALLFLGAFLSFSTLLPHLNSSQVWLLGGGATLLGLSLPNFFLNRIVERRQRTLRNAFPDALDLLVVCVESGLGLAAGLQRVAQDLRISYPALASELERVNAEMQAGMEREQALRNLATRTGLSDIRSLVGLLVQTMRFGTSVADALRVYSEEFREKRMQLAEEQAAKLGTKMIFPMVLCFFPCFFLVAIGPVIIKVIRIFGGIH